MIDFKNDLDLLNLKKTVNSKDFDLEHSQMLFFANSSSLCRNTFI